MTDKINKKTMSDAHNSHHAKKRRERRDQARNTSHKPMRAKKHIEREEQSRLLIYGLHTVRNAIENPMRVKKKLYCTKNGLARLELDENEANLPAIEEFLPRDLDRMVGSDAVHQGVVLEVEPLTRQDLESLNDAKLVLVLDQVTDPHNVGAIMRSAVAMGAGGMITTSRYSPVESGVLAKSASGALDLISHIEVRNLADCLEALHEKGFTTIGLDSEEAVAFETIGNQERIALVLGAEGKGLREKTRKTCQYLAKLDMPGPIKSLNVSNAAILSLYLASQLL